MELSQQLLAVGLVLALLWLLGAAAKKRGWLRLNSPLRKASRGSLELVDRLSLTPQHQLHLLRVEGRTLLIATHPGGVATLDTHPEPAHASAAAQGGRSS